MALTTSSQFSNRYGLNTKIYAAGTYTGNDGDTVLLDIDFANISEINISGDTVWATGGQSHGNKVAFNNSIAGTFKLSTQIMTSKLLALMAGKDIASATNVVVFENTPNSVLPAYYTIVSDTVWRSKDGETYSENLVFHKAIAKRALNIQYNGDGDPVSVDIEFELAEDDNGQVLTITKEDDTPATPTTPETSDPEGE